MLLMFLLMVSVTVVPKQFQCWLSGNGRLCICAFILSRFLFKNVFTYFL